MRAVQTGYLNVQALATANQVKLSGPFTGDTPTIMAPASVSPLNPDDPGPTPMDVDTPGEAGVGLGASGAPFAQRKGGLYRQALQSAFEAARLAGKKDLVRFSSLRPPPPPFFA